MIHYPSNIKAPKACRYLREAMKNESFEAADFWDNFNADIEAVTLPGDRKGWDAVLSDHPGYAGISRNFKSYDQLELVGGTTALKNNEIAIKTLITYSLDHPAANDHRLRLILLFDTDLDQIKSLDASLEN